jgi:hypothetical protein
MKSMYDRMAVSIDLYFEIRTLKDFPHLRCDLFFVR